MQCPIDGGKVPVIIHSLFVSASAHENQNLILWNGKKQCLKAMKITN